ncbi:DUF4279 domain-containing protein [Mesorhizobium australicum]|uniref:DUF4279 domain-containing protein n=1 Tax=Mesorhizobium australicum TaxID=536018 RepID=A0A1X7Q0X4_9HYPH|nr:DUF4279 domain-containing protein [Mesorhizobium australicum]SMH57988.1 protein of unknown function [Mesorhizobium australicum]
MSPRPSLRFFGDTLDPQEISRQLACAPTTAERKGDLMGPKRNIIARTGGWKLSFVEGQGDQLDRQISRLLAATVASSEVWKHLTQAFEADVFCGVWLDEPMQGLSLEPATLAELGLRGLRLELDIYYSDPTDPEE